MFVRIVRKLPRAFFAAALFAATLPLAMSCGGGEGVLGVIQGPPTVTTAFVTVPSGTETMPVLVANNSLLGWGYGACSLVIDRQDEGRWSTIFDSTRLTCNALAQTMEPGASFTRQIALPREPGTYRIRLKFFDRGEDVFATSNSFEISDGTSAEEL